MTQISHKLTDYEAWDKACKQQVKDGENLDLRPLTPINKALKKYFNADGANQYKREHVTFYREK